jgi:hypothetical protein
VQETRLPSAGQVGPERLRQEDVGELGEDHLSARRGAASLLPDQRKHWFDPGGDGRGAGVHDHDRRQQLQQRRGHGLAEREPAAEEPRVGAIAATLQPGVRIERVVGDQLVEAGHGRARLVAHGVPLAPGQYRKLAGAEPHRVKALGLQPAGTLKDEVELGRVRAIDHEPPWRAQVGQAAHAAVHLQRGQQLGHRVAGRIVQQLHGSLRLNEWIRELS